MKFLGFVITLSAYISVLSGCSSNNAEIENIKAFSELYGYVRWFHPSDEAQQIDWNKFAVYGIQKVEKASTTEDLIDSLNALFLPIAPTLRISKISEEFDLDSSWINRIDSVNHRCIAWQHCGVDLGAPENVAFSSVRTNRGVKNACKMWPQLMNYTSAYGLANKKIRVKVSSKSNDKGKIGLFITSIENYEFPNLPNIIKPIYYDRQHWSTIEASMDLGEKENVIFGVINESEGEIMVDNFILDVKNDVGWESVKISNGDLNSISFNNAPEDYIIIKNALYDINIKSYKSKQEQDNYVSIMPKKSINLFDKHSKVGDIFYHTINKDIKICMPLALWGNEHSTFPKADSLALINLKSEVNQNFNNKYNQLASLSIFWNVMKHFYPYINEINTDWDKDFLSAVKETYLQNNEKSFLKTLQKFTAKLKDGHILINSPALDNNIGLLPFTWEWIENKLVITSVLAGNLKLKTGDVVDKINGKYSSDYFADKQQYISESTKGGLLYSSQLITLQGNKQDSLILSVKHDSGLKSKIKVKYSLSPGEFYSSTTNHNKYKLISGDIYYLNFENINMQEIEALMPHLITCKGIICDFRGYSKNNTKFLKHLLIENDTANSWLKVPRIIYPNQEKIVGYEEYGWGGTPKEPHLGMPVVFITDARAISFAESILSIVKHYKLGIIIGQTTAGTNGNVNVIKLPNGLSVRFTGVKTMMLDGSKFHGVGILPDIFVNKTINGIKEGRDEYLEKSIEIINQKVRTN